MIVNDLKNFKNNLYYVTIDNVTYKFDEEIVLEYRLVKGKTLKDDLLEEILHKNDLSKIYNQTANYALKYLKSKKACFYYLIEKGINQTDALEITNNLSNKLIINDNLNSLSIMRSYISQGYGILYIKNKLYERLFAKESIENSLNQVDYEDYNLNLKKQYNKALIKYSKETNDFIKLNKIKRSLLSRGYLIEEIESIIKE